MDKRGYVLTCAHVIATTCDTTVQLHSGETFTASVVNVDEAADLALLKLAEVKSFPVLKFGKSSELRSGEWVIALGSPLSFKNTVTSGIVSTVSRTSKEIWPSETDMEYIQTDAAIFSGNSGGPLVNLDGEVIGINALSYSRSASISFAVPSQIAQEFMNVAIETFIQEKTFKNYMGISIMPLNPQFMAFLYLWYGVPMDLEGVILMKVWPNSPASDAGLQVYDIIVKIDGTPITSASQVYDMVKNGKPLSIEVIRGQEKHEITVTPKPIM